jgi:hypothetical protein
VASSSPTDDAVLPAKYRLPIRRLGALLVAWLLLVLSEDVLFPANARSAHRARSSAQNCRPSRVAFPTLVDTEGIVISTDVVDDGGSTNGAGRFVVRAARWPVALDSSPDFTLIFGRQSSVGAAVVISGCGVAVIAPICRNGATFES